MDMNTLSENVKEHWNAWELRTLILLSLLLQIFLVIFGNRRKYMAGRWLGPFVWFAYLSADWVATFSLGVLARSQGTELASSQGDEGKISTNPKFIPLFWAPALLLHLGGPDTITAYAMQDNDFGIRRLLEAITQVVIVIYVLIKLWSKDNLPFVAISILFVGFYKYGERIWVLRLASSKKLRASAFNAMFYLEHRHPISEGKFLFDAHMLFGLFKGLLSNLLLDNYHVRASRHIINLHAECSSQTDPSPLCSRTIFKLIEAELGFAYDVFYTKMGTVHPGRFFLRLICFLLTISALVVFSTTINKHDFSRIDIMISYILLVVAVVFEIYSSLMFLSSDWMRKDIKGMSNIDIKRWSGLMAQHDLLIAFQLNENRWDKCLEALLDKGAEIQGWEKVRDDLEQLIFNSLLQRSRTNNIRTLDGLRTALQERGSKALGTKDCINDFGWSVVDLEFDQSLLVWHIATSICYWDEFRKSRETGGKLDARCKMSQYLSNYMMYLLVEHPSMLPKGIYEPRYRYTKGDLFRSFVPPLHLGDLHGKIVQPEGEGKDIVQPINEDTVQREGEGKDIVQQEGEDIVQQVKQETSAFDGGRRLARLLEDKGEDVVQQQGEGIVQQVKEETSAFDGGRRLVRLLHGKEFKSSEEKWEMISEVWVEMLIYAAGQCEWKEHAQALTQGGELITLVSLLKAHLGLTLQRSAKGFDPSRLDDEFDLWLETTLSKSVQRAVDIDRPRNDGSPSLTEELRVREAEMGNVADMA